MATAVVSRRRRSRRAVEIAAAATALLGGVGALCLALAPAEVVERSYGVVQQEINRVKADVWGETPSVILGAEGGAAELARADGTFTHMLSYEHPGVPPVWAAHNNAGGDTILTLEVGDRIRVTMPDRTVVHYVVSDVRITGKHWVTTEALIGLGGELALQTCFYGDPRMKFIGLQAA